MQLVGGSWADDRGRNERVLQQPSDRNLGWVVADLPQNAGVPVGAQARYAWIRRSGSSERFRRQSEHKGVACLPRRTLGGLGLR